MGKNSNKKMRHITMKVIALMLILSLAFSMPVSAETTGDTVNLPAVKGDGIFDGPVKVSANYASYKEKLSDKLVHTWCEYVPTSYNKDTAVPLVIVLHGGALNGYDQGNGDAWNLLSERENFITVYPSNTGNKGGYDPVNNNWKIDYSGDNVDVEYLKLLIEKLETKYNIDKTRIYMTGYSWGDMMALNFATVHGNMLAGLASVVGPTAKGFMVDVKGNQVTPKYALPVLQYRGDNDIFAPTVSGMVTTREGKHSLNWYNKSIWQKINNTTSKPVINIMGNYNTEVYKGEGNCNLVYMEIFGQGHGIAGLGEEYLWDFFSQYTRNADGSVGYTPNNTTPEADNDSIAVEIGSNNMYLNGKVVKMNDNRSDDTVTVVNDVAYVPVEILKTAYGANITYYNEGQQAVIIIGDKTINIAKNNMQVIVNNESDAVTSQVKVIDNKLQIPLVDFTQHILGKYANTRNDVILISDKEDTLSFAMTKTIKKML